MAAENTKTIKRVKLRRLKKLNATPISKKLIDISEFNKLQKDKKRIEVLLRPRVCLDTHLGDTIP